MITVKNLCETCSHYWIDYPFPIEHCVGHCEIVDEKIGFGKMDEVVPYPCVNCPFNAYKKSNTIKWYSECNCCGAITIHFNNGTHKEVSKKYIKDNDIDLTKSVRLANSYHCENCYPMEKVCEYIMK